MRGFLYLLALALVCSSAWAVNGDMGIGTEPLTDGSETYPYLIEDVNDFDEFADPNFAATYWASGVYTKLMTDIDLAGRTYTTAVIAPDTSHNQNGEFVDTPFSGILDGNGYTINNLTINSAGASNNYLGLVGQIEGSNAQIKNLDIEDYSITGGGVSAVLGGLCGRNYGSISNCFSNGSLTGGNYLGGLCGYNDDNGSISKSCSTSSVTGHNNLGGLCGYNYQGSIADCYSGGSVTGGNSSGYLGGLCGFNFGNGSITNCYSTGSVTGGDDADYFGGLCGINFGNISKSYSTGSVTGDDNLGGLCGINYGSISNCYSTGSVTGGDSSNGLGGLCGTNTGNCTISNSYSIGLVTSGDGSNYFGGLCGLNAGTITNCFWDTEISLMTTSAGGIGKTTDEMQTEITFTGWDFSNTWFMSGYPVLAWQGDLGGGDGTQANPYLIENIVDFDKFCSDPNYWASGVHTKLMTDIDLSGRTYTTAVIAPDTNMGGVFDGTSFNGIFNGNGHVISNLTIDTLGTGNDYLGLFGEIGLDGSVKDFGIEHVNIKGGDGSRYLAALCGRNRGAISGCYSTGLVTGSIDSWGTGGLCGYNGDFLDGLGGTSSISNCYSTVNVMNTTGSCGGLCGANQSGSISNCYATGPVTSDITPFNPGPGGLCGGNLYGSISDCFWDTETSGVVVECYQSPEYPGTITNVVGKTTAEMMTQSTFTGWDFTTPVRVMLREHEDYPRLACQEVFLGDIAGLYGADMVDFAYLAQYWGLDCGTHDCGRADIDGSGDVGIGDLSYIAQDWLCR